MIKQVNVTGSKAFAYLRTQLEIGISLSQRVAKLTLDKGRVFAFVPEGVSDETLYNFDSGGIYPFNKGTLENTSLIPIQNDSRPIVLDQIENFIDDNASNCCIFEDPNASPDFPWVKESAMEYIHLNNQEMFFFFDRSNSNKEKLKDAFTTSEVYIFLCVLCRLNLNQHAQFSQFKEITIGALELLVENIQHFIVKAYDGEGYLMWSATQ